MMDHQLPISLSIVIPVYNEIENLEPLLNQLEFFCQTSNCISEYEVIVVDDGSTDGTVLAAQQYARKHQVVNVITHQVNRGYGAALTSGFRQAKFDYIFFTDGDGQFKISDLNLLLPHTRLYEVVIGYRAQRNDPFIRSWFAYGWNVIIKLLFGLRVTDINCAFKLFKRELITHSTFQSSGATFSVELLLCLRKSKSDFKEVPVPHYPRQRGQASGANIRVIFTAFVELFRLYLTNFGVKK